MTMLSLYEDFYIVCILFYELIGSVNDCKHYQTIIILVWTVDDVNSGFVWIIIVN